MSLLTINLPSVHNGVSQQPPQVRSTDQSEALENTWASVADGLVKRPPTEAVAKLEDAPLDNVYIHDINRDASERYTVIVADGEIRVFDADGVEQTVEAPAGWDYLDGVEDYGLDLSLTTIADYTFVVNRKVVCEMREPDDTDPLPGEDDFVIPRHPGSRPPNELGVIP